MAFAGMPVAERALPAELGVVADAGEGIEEGLFRRIGGESLVVFNVAVILVPGKRPSEIHRFVHGGTASAWWRRCEAGTCSAFPSPCRG